MSKYWEIAEGKVDSRKFFEARGNYFPDATTLYVEGTSISEDVRACYLSHQEQDPMYRELKRGGLFRRNTAVGFLQGL